MTERVPTIPTDSSPEVGSVALAAALAARDVPAIGQALRHDYVVVPLVRTQGGETQTRVFQPEPAGDKPYELCLFSSARSLAAFIGAAPDRDFALQRGPSLLPFLKQYADVLTRVTFDPAGPYPMQASVADVEAALLPQPGDDEVAWVATVQDVVAASELPGESRPGQTIAFDMRLPKQWFVINLRDEGKRAHQIDQLTRQQLRGLGDSAAGVRRELAGWLRATTARAAGSGGQFLAFLLQRNETAAIALSLVLYWHDLGPSLGGDTHLDRVAATLRAQLGPDDELLGADTAAGPFLRHTHLSRGAEELTAVPRPMLLLDFWLARPDGRGLVLVSFSTPHVEAREAIALLADNVVLNGAWVIDGDA